MHMDFEPEFLGTMKIICAGKVKVLLVSGGDLQRSNIVEASADAKDNNKDSVAEGVRKYFHGLKTDDAIKKLFDAGVKVHHGTLDFAAASLLVTPPGWFQMTCVVEDEAVVGLRVSHLSKTASAKHNLEACM